MGRVDLLILAAQEDSYCTNYISCSFNDNKLIFVKLV
jgi:hypothetical protein